MADDLSKSDDVEELMKLLGVASPPTGAREEAKPEVRAGEPKPPQLEPLVPAIGKAEASIDLLKDVNLHVKVELGRTRLLVQDILRLSPGSVVELDHLTGDPLDVYVNDRLVARGEVLVINENFAVRVTEVVHPASRQE